MCCATKRWIGGPPSRSRAARGSPGSARSSGIIERFGHAPAPILPFRHKHPCGADEGHAASRPWAGRHRERALGRRGWGGIWRAALRNRQSSGSCRGLRRIDVGHNAGGAGVRSLDVSRECAGLVCLDQRHHAASEAGAGLACTDHTRGR